MIFVGVIKPIAGSKKQGCHNKHGGNGYQNSFDVDRSFHSQHSLDVIETQTKQPKI